VRRVDQGAARGFGVDLNSVRRVLRSGEPPRYERPAHPSKLDPFEGEIHGLSRADPKLPGARVREPDRVRRELVLVAQVDSRVRLALHEVVEADALRLKGVELALLVDGAGCTSPRIPARRAWPGWAG
jgi:hypothetical protein